MALLILCKHLKKICITFHSLTFIFLFTKMFILFRRQEEITAEREEIDRQKKLLLKKRPSNSESGRKRNNSSASSALHNGTDSTFLKPDAVPGSFSLQEYYEADEILKVRKTKIYFSSKIFLRLILSTVKAKCVKEGRCGFTIRNGKIRKRT